MGIGSNGVCAGDQEGTLCSCVESSAAVLQTVAMAMEAELHQLICWQKITLRKLKKTLG